jgi:uncharacterized repeat protein (TIGR03803 family)
MKCLLARLLVSDESLRNIHWTLAAALINFLLFASAATSQTLSTLYTFTGGADGAYPSSLAIDPSGNVYGTTFLGGDLTCEPSVGCGVIFEVSASQQFTVLHTFTGVPDGELPSTFGVLLLGPQGILVGETSAGGSGGGGTIFSVNPATAKVTILYNFSNIANGYYPAGGLIHDSAGNLYGTTVFGGDATCDQGSGCGTVFKLNGKHVLSTLYSFSGSPDGIQPESGVIRDAAGNLYGTTVYGGAQCPESLGCGTVFKIDPAGNESILYTFTGGTDGGLPFGGLIRDAKGNLYGTAGAFGPPPAPDGVVFGINPARTELVLHSFSGTDGNSPRGGLVADSTGNLYGTTTYGGTGTCPFGCGTVFKIDRQGHETVLYNFTGLADGANPVSTLVLDSAGNLYGTTTAGGDSSCITNSGGCGTVFKLTP